MRDEALHRWGLDPSITWAPGTGNQRVVIGTGLANESFSPMENPPGSGRPYRELADAALLRRAARRP
ncbi:MAG TPA: hypothetical protein VL172_08250, partial [Kofleriaceae bacterium]|nr:hypothetical protein [Kofleriaceae bacterium]